MNLNELIKSTIDYNICEYIINNLKEYQPFDKAFINNINPELQYWYVCNVIKGSQKQVTYIMLRTPLYYTKTTKQWKENIHHFPNCWYVT